MRPAKNRHIDLCHGISSPFKLPVLLCRVATNSVQHAILARAETDGVGVVRKRWRNAIVRVDMQVC